MVNGSGQPMISIYNKNISKLRMIGSILEENGVEAHYYKSSTREVWQLYITGRKNLLLLLRKVGLDHPDKREKLIAMLALKH